MNSVELYAAVSARCSKEVTSGYSTSFSSAIHLLHKDFREPICAIYGFVRLADEIVDTFHDQDKELLLQRYSQDTWDAIERGFSLNPILQSFQKTVKDFHIPVDLIVSFLHSMEMDLVKQNYLTKEDLDEYIFGSAEVVGLMCLMVFCEGDIQKYQHFKEPARALGAAFQKVNFLRDLKADLHSLQRSYFPKVDFREFNDELKKQIEQDIEKDFRSAFSGIRVLPLKAKFGVYVAYNYYLSLFNKIRKLQSRDILSKRVRIPNYTKAMIILESSLKNRLNLI